MKIDLSQDELKAVVTILSQVQLAYRDSRTINPIIYKLESNIERPPQPIVEGEVLKEVK